MASPPWPTDQIGRSGASAPRGGLDQTSAASDFLIHDRLEVGDPAAPFILPDPGGTQWSPLDNDIAGKPLLLLFLADGNAAQACADLAPLIAAHDELRQAGCGIFALTRAAPGPEVTQALPAAADGKPIFPLLNDSKGEAFRAYGLSGAQASVAILLTANMKIAFIGGASGRTIPRVRDELRRMAQARPAIALAAHPPILLVPVALSAADCGFLMQLWQRLDQDHGAIGHSDVDPKCVSFLHEYGRVKQYLVEDARLQEALDAKLARRIMPELSKAFDTRAPQREAYALSCYDANDGGMLQPHRDCASQETRHRRFTVTVALNDGYQGGALRFREYGEQTYNLPIGAAAIFSAAVLHEVLPITSGRRFALVTHIYGT